MSQTEVQLIKADAVQTGDIANSAVTDAKISGVASSKLTGALPAISGAALTNLPASGKAKNLVHNGAMLVNQRGVASATGSGYKTVDRMRQYYNNMSADVTMSHQDVAAGTTPYTEGFRKSVRLTNGNQGSAQAAYEVKFQHKIEAQDIAGSGWNYVSASSNITLQFWVKSSVAQNFYFHLQTSDGTAQAYVMETGSLSADTWTKITKTIPGNSNLQFDRNNGEGLRIEFAGYYGSNFTGTRPLNAWAAYNSATRNPTNTATWVETNGATLEFTGLQLEVGDQATNFEHLTFGEYLLKCQRYYYIQASSKHNSSGEYEIEFISANMRATPTATRLSGVYFGGESSTSFSSIQTLTASQSSEVVTMVYVLVNSSDANCGGKYAFAADL